jgi:hypothetical protein
MSEAPAAHAKRINDANRSILAIRLLANLPVAMGSPAMSPL